MKTSGRATLRSVMVVLAFALSALVLPSGAHQAFAETAGAVDCDSGGDLNTPLTNVDPGGTVTIFGTCHGIYTINKPVTIQGGTIQGSGSGPAVTISPGSGKVTLQNLTITGGTGVNGDNGIPIVHDDGYPAGPGGLDIKNGTVTLSNVTISNNLGGSGGDGAHDLISKLKALIGGNGGKGGAGGVLVEGGTVLFTGVTMSGNAGGGGGNGYGPAAEAGYGADAGPDAMQIDGGAVTIANSTITNNTRGAAISIGGDSNTSPGSGGHGSVGGIQLSGGTVDVYNSTISGNAGGTGGDAGDNSITGGSGNEGGGGSGGLWVSGGTMNVYNSTLSGNTGGYPGGGVLQGEPLGRGGDGAATITGGALNLYYTTVSANHTQFAGYPSGVEGLDNQGGTVTAYASILATTGHKGFSGENQEIDCAGTIKNAGYNVLGFFNLEGTGVFCTYDPQFPDPGTPAAASMFSDGSGMVLSNASTGPQRGTLLLNALQAGTNSTPLMTEQSGSGSIGLVAESVCDAGIPGPSGSGIPNTGGTGDLIFADQRGVSRAHANCDAGAFQTLRRPTVDLLHDTADDTGISQTDDVTSNNRPTFKGQLVGGTGLTATIYDNGQAMGTSLIGGTLGNNNFFFFQPPSALSDGVHTITATARDPDSGQIVTSLASKVTVETGPPNVFIVPRNQPFSSTGIYDPDTGGKTLTVTAGVSDPGGVTALSCTDGATNVASINNSSASPQITQDVTLGSGSHSISCSGTGAAGNHGSQTQSFFVKRSSGFYLASGATDSHGITRLTAGLADDLGNGLNGKTITFYVRDSNGNWVQVCDVSGQPSCPLTQTVGGNTGQATLAGPTLPDGYPAGDSSISYPGVVKATFAGDAQDSAAGATGNLTVASLPPGIVFDCPNTEAALQSDIIRASAGGQVRLLCQHDKTIHFDTAGGGLGTPISLYQVTISTVGSPARVILDGGGQTQLFHIADPSTLPPGSLHASVEIDGLQFQNGHTDGGGGAMTIEAGTTAVLNSDTFTGNSSGIAEGLDSGAGGAIANAGTLTLTNDTFSQNNSLIAGGALANTGTATITFSTFSGNVSLDPGGAIISTGGSITMGGDIVADTSEGFNPPCFIPGGTIDNGYNLESNGTPSTASTCGFNAPTDIVGTDPRLGPLQDNSGDTAPETVDFISGIGGLPDSPAIDAIPSTSTLCPAPANQSIPLRDERNVARPTGSGCDIGSYEYIWGSAPALSNVRASETYSPSGPVPVSLTATLKDQNGQPLVGKIIVFLMPNDHGQLAPLCGGADQVDCPATGNDGVATLEGIDLPNATLNAGTYQGGVVARFTGDTTDNGADAMGELDVARAQNVVSLSFDSPLAPLPPQSYGAPPINLTDYSTFDGTGITFQSETTGVCTVNGAVLVTVGAGVCTIQASGPATDDNHSDAVPVEASFTVGPATLQVFASGGTIIAGQNPPAITATFGGFQPGDTAATALNGTPDCSTTATASSPAGDYDTSCTQGTLGSANYTFQFVKGTLHLQQPTATISLDTSTLNPVYNGNPRDVTATTDPADLPYSVSYTDANGNPTGPPTTPGVYTVTARIIAQGQIALPVTGTLFLHKAVLLVTCDNQTMTSGDPIPTLTYSVGGNFVGNDDSSVIQGTPSCSTPATPSSPPDQYPIIADVSGLTAANYDIIRGTDGTLTINGAPTSLSVASASGAYGGTSDLSATLTSGGSPVSGETIEFTLNGVAACGGSTGTPCPTTDDTGVATLAGASLSGIDAGSYPSGVGAGFDGDATYGASSGVGSLDVGQATPPISWSDPASIVYGAALSGDQLDATSTVPGSFTYSPSLDTVLHAGTSQSLSVTFTPDDATNYTTATKTVHITVTQAPLTVTASGGSMTFAGSPPAIAPLYDGFVNKDDENKLDTAPTCTTDATSSSPVGSYASTCTGGQSSDYSFKYLPGSVQVTPASATISLDSGTLSPTYNASPRAVTATTGPVGLSYSLTYQGINGTTYGPSADAPTDAGTYHVTATIADPNYTGGTDGTLTIGQAPLSVSCDDQQKTYGDDNPTLTGSISGVKGADGIGYTCTTSAGKTTGAGTATITAATTDPKGRLGNYSVSLHDGTLTIKRSGSATDLTSSLNPTSSGQPVTFSATVTAGGPATGAVTFKNGTATLGTISLNGSGVATITTSALTAGPHSITASYSGDHNVTGSSSTLTQHVDTALGGYPKQSNGAYNLHNVALSGAYLVGWILTGANMTNSAFSSANFTNADLTGADLSNSNFTSANFTGATLSHVTLKGANLSSANFTNANLKGATQLSTAKLSGTIWSNTVCPDGTNSNSHKGTCTGHG